MIYLILIVVIASNALSIYLSLRVLNIEVKDKETKDKETKRTKLSEVWTNLDENE